MKIFSFIIILLLLIPMETVFAVAEDRMPKTEKQRISYAIGMLLARQFKAEQFDLSPSALIKGIKDQRGERQPLLTEQEMEAAIVALHEQSKSKKVEQSEKNRSRIGKKNLAEGKKFLDQNKKKKGINVLPNGLQYEIIKSGKGKSPNLKDRVSVHFRLFNLQGGELDTSYFSKKPPGVELNSLIPGWREALVRMNVGAEWKIFIPQDLAYGNKGTIAYPFGTLPTRDIAFDATSTKPKFPSGHVQIETNQTLIYTISLVSID